MDAMCCVDCFAHEWLREHVRDNSDEKGDCNYCGRKGADLIPIGALYEPFKNLMQLYVPSDDPRGEMLIDLIQWDYEVFDDELHSLGVSARLLENIMETGWDDDSGEPRVGAHELYHRRSSLWSHSTMTESWDEFCEEVKVNPERQPELPALLEEDLARMEVELSSDTVLYRARIGFPSASESDMQPFRGPDIAAPPAEKAKPGRANFKGEVVLYVADQEVTAVAEVRPWRGLLVSVAQLTVTRNVRLVDLTKSPPPSNPFTDEAPQYERELEELLLAFGEELGRPLRRADDPRDYLPCQKLVHRIRQSGFYDGIRYPSAMAPGGSNVVIFDPDLARIGPSKLIEVLDVGLAYAPFEDV